MEFWGTEVKPGQTVSCDAGNGYVIHVSQAALGETKKGSEKVVVSVKVDDKKVIIGTLSADNHPQTLCDLIFEKEFELSHSSKTASVFLCGYKTVMPDPFESDSGEDEDEEEDANENQVMNHIIGKSKVKAPTNDGKKGKDDARDEDDSDDSDDDLDLSSSDDDLDLSSSDDDSDLSSSDDVMAEDESNSEEDEPSSEESDEEDEETPKKPDIGKKRVAETALKTPASDKKVKIATPSGQKTGDKKGAHVATPHPAKQSSKTPANSKSKEKSPKSTGGTHACKSCSKTFGSGSALQSHEKAKHK